MRLSCIFVLFIVTCMTISATAQHPQWLIKIAQTYKKNPLVHPEEFGRICYNENIKHSIGTYEAAILNPHRLAIEDLARSLFYKKTISTIFALVILFWGPKLYFIVDPNNFFINLMCTCLVSPYLYCALVLPTHLADTKKEHSEALELYGQTFIDLISENNLINIQEN